MKNILKKFSIATALGGAGVIAIGFFCYAVGARFNTTKSIPLGLYWTSNSPAVKGKYVLFCPPLVASIAEAKRRGYLGAGFCPGDYGYMMKKILATDGDAVAITDAGVSVNGVLLSFSAPRTMDRAGRPLQRFEPVNFIIDKSEVLLMSDVSATSFDGRYFGPVHRALIKSVVVPVITW
jgi:conjugative transfer signal peptidase TraF